MRTPLFVARMFAFAAFVSACSTPVQPPDAATADSSSSEVALLNDANSDDVSDGMNATDSASNDAPTVERRPCVSGCDDGEACTLDRCGADRYCQNIPIASCPGCRSDAECDDRDPNTIDQCNPLTRFCGHQLHGDCSDLRGPDCNDGDPCTIDNCNALGMCTQGPNYACCHYDETCDDGNPCTTDRCMNHQCVRTAIAGCADPSCPDADRDGARSARCGGDDCDDFDPRRHPRAMELCSDRQDNNCNNLVDGSDPACAPANAMCANAVALTSGMSVQGRIPGSVERATLCSAVSAFYRLELREASDVHVELTITDTPADTMPSCPGCPLRPAPNSYQYAAFLRSSCGSAVVEGTPSTCSSYLRNGLYPLMPLRFDRLRLPAGIYYLEVQASAENQSDPRGVEFTLQATVTPSVAPACSTAPALVDGRTVRGNPAMGRDAFSTRCNNSVEHTNELLYRIELPEPRRVKIVATPTTPSAASRVAVLSACDATAMRTSCVETTGRSTCTNTNTTYAQLPAGTHWVVIEPTGTLVADTQFDVTFTSEAPNAACAGAQPIRASGSFMGTTAGGSSRFGSQNTCGAGEGNDVAYTLSIAARSRVVLDVIASFMDPQVRILRGCGGAVVASSSSSTARVDTMLDPGEYVVVVDADARTSAGNFVLNATLLAL